MNQEPWTAAWLLDKVWLVAIAFVGFVWKTNDKQLAANRQASDDGIAAARKSASDALATHKAEDEKEFRTLNDELHLQRGHIGKLFDKLEENGRRSEERHRELMERAHDGHRELLMALNSKVDK
jgi:hypothetical protein